MPVSRRAKRLESVIGIVFLLHLVLVVVALLVIQSRFDMARFGVSTAALPEQETASKFSDIAPAGFEALSKAESYNADNLYEKIDGKAPLYLEAGFKELSTQQFVNTDDPNQWMELYVYDMGALRNAFSVYSVQKRADSQAFPSMQLGTPQSGNPFAYKSSNALYFVHGRYYIEIVGSSESDELFKAMTEIAANVQTNLAIDADAKIAELAFFPQENLVSDSFKLYIVSAFGCEKLTDTFTARYKLGNEAVTAFLSKRHDSKDAEATAESYHNFLIDNGAVIKNTDKKALAGKIMDSYGTTEIVFSVGTFVAGIHEAENQQDAETLAEILINKLDSLKNE
jgi:hypothetical protein